jgi:acyl-CoA synthetase (AMP-forming)/AMP-acid ligase II
VDDVINVSGHRIGTAEVESALVGHEHCAEAAVVPMEHPIKGQGIYAFVTLMGDQTYPPDEYIRKALIAQVRRPQPRAPAALPAVHAPAWDCCLGGWAACLRGCLPALHFLVLVCLQCTLCLHFACPAFLPRPPGVGHLPWPPPGIRPCHRGRLQVRKAIGPIATPDVIHWAPGLPKTRSGKIMRRILRKIANHEESSLGDISTLADPGVVQQLLEMRGK